MRRLRFAWSALFLHLLGAAGCGDDASTGGSAPVGGGGEAGSGGSGAGEPDCASKGGACLPIPAGWQGPIELTDSGNTVCTNEAFRGTYAGEPFEAAPAACECACVGTSACEIELVGYGDGACGKDALEVAAVPDTCQAAPVGAVGFTVTSSPSGACASDGANPNVSPIDFATTVVGCNINLDSCEPNVACVPDIRTFCFYSDTESECPEGFVDARDVLREEDFADNRSCSCSCSPGDVSCTPTVELFSDVACATALDAPTVDGCTSSETTPAAIRVTSGVDGACERTENVVGSVSQSGAGILVCCAP
jgi:hypothetical protein